MTDIKHHLSDALLMAYSAGTLPEGFNLVVATHVSMCDECRARMHSFDAVGGAILEEDILAEMGDDAFAATLAMIKGFTPEAAVVQKPRSLLPAPLQDYVGQGLEDVNWKSLGGGVKHAVLKTSKQATARLVMIPAGCAVPDHGHRGMELTLVLQGAFADDEDRFGRGDIEIADEDLHHTPVAEMGEDCICLTATDAPLKFNSWIPRIAQPFLRI